MFNTCGGVLREGVPMRYRAIQEHARRDPIRLMCRALAVSPAGYSAWRDRPESRRATANRTLLSTIRGIHGESRATYGSPSIWNALVKQGHCCGHASHRAAYACRRDPGQNREAVARDDAVGSPVARSRDHPSSPVHGVASPPGVGWR